MPARIASPPATRSDPGRVVNRFLEPVTARTDRSAPSVTAPAPEIKRSSIHVPSGRRVAAPAGRGARFVDPR